MPRISMRAIDVDQRRAPASRRPWCAARRRGAASARATGAASRRRPRRRSRWRLVERRRGRSSTAALPVPATSVKRMVRVIEVALGQLVHAVAGEAVAAGIEHVGDEHGVVERARPRCRARFSTTQSNLMLWPILRTAGSSSSGFMPRDRVAGGELARQRPAAEQILVARPVRERHVAGLARRQRQREADELGSVGVERVGFRVEGDEPGLARAGDPGVELVEECGCSDSNWYRTGSSRSRSRAAATRRTWHASGTAVQARVPASAARAQPVPDLRGGAVSGRREIGGRDAVAPARRPLRPCLELRRPALATSRRRPSRRGAGRARRRRPRRRRPRRRA